MPQIPAEQPLGERIISPKLPTLSYPSEVWALSVSTHAKILLICLWSYANRDGSSCFPGRKSLARDCGYSVKQVTRATHELESKGLVEVQRSPNKANQYVLNYPYGENYPGDSQSLGRDSQSPDMDVIDDDDEKKTSRKELEREAIALWNRSAKAHGLPPIRSPLAPTRLKRLLAIEQVYPDFWLTLNAALPRRSSWYVSHRQPNFDQATRRSYFDSKILEGTWNGTDDRTDAERRQAEYEASFKRLD